MQREYITDEAWSNRKISNAVVKMKCQQSLEFKKRFYLPAKG
jgi:hypothetical protein